MKVIFYILSISFVLFNSEWAVTSLSEEISFSQLLSVNYSACLFFLVTENDGLQCIDLS